jgi:mono/diheme cytochrome c family protein
MIMAKQGIGLKQLRGKVLACGLLFSFLGLLSNIALAQLPELASPSTGSGASTTARFFAGATADDSSSFGANFSGDQVLDVLAEVQVESAHVNTVGNIYLVILLGEDLLMRLESSEYVVWDGTLPNLQATLPDKTLQASEPITIVENLAFGPAGLAGQSFSVFLGYDTQAAPGEFYFSGVPLTFAIEAEAADPASLTFYVDNISEPIVQSQCIVCHTVGGVAGVGLSALQYVSSSVEGFQQTNYNTLLDYIENVPNGSSLILSKPQGLPIHTGGVLLTPGSSQFATWSEFVALSQNDIASNGNGTNVQSIFSAVAKMDNEQTLRKAALLYAGRLPTEQEISSVDSGSEEDLAVAVRGLMTGDGFENFLMESANNRLLTEAFSASVFSVVNRFYYPNSYQYFQVPNTAGSDKRLTAEALAQEPLRLVANVVTNERPYTEVLTADYVMVNPYSAEVYGGNVTFDNPGDPDEWREGRITEYYRCTVCAQNEQFANYNISTEYPHAGLLNSPAFLSRFPSTDTNRNRARARWAYYFFLGVDIEGLSERTTDQAALADENNPTLNNENCTVCHNIMDPVAGAFQNYGDEGFYKDQPGGLHSLPGSYRFDPASGYQQGDTWYSDMLAPGFGDELAPNSDNSIQWLAQEFTKDPRFGYGSVYFWYPAVMGRDPYALPENPEDIDYESKLVAYSTEQQMMQDVAENFVAGSAGNGDHNLKDLLVDLSLSEHFRAESVEAITAAQEVELDEVGTGKLLTPEQLNRKLETTTGFSWEYGSFSALEEVYDLIYGGIDSSGITERATDLTTLMSTVVTAMANEVSCPITAQEFGLIQSQRKLFPFVQLDSLPTNSATAIRNNIQYLHSVLLGEELSIDDSEITATFDLFAAVWNARVAANKGPSVISESEICITENVVNPVLIDSNQTLRSWAAVLNYMIRDYKFIHE